MIIRENSKPVLIRRILLLLVMSGCFLKASSQTFKTDYKPQREYRPSKVLMDDIAASYKQSIESVNHSDKRVKQHVKESIRRLSRSVTMRDSVFALMQTDTLSQYLSTLLSRIQSKNPQLNGNDYHIFTYRTSVPNASSAGLGVLMINLDLISKLKSEQELAFIICHELAHDMQKHVLNGINENAKRFYEKEFQDQLKEISKQEFNRMKEIESLITELLEQFSEHSRGNELEADSIGLMLFYNAGYSPDHALSATYMLDSVDYPVYFEQVRYKVHFNFANYPFNPEWLKEDGSLLDLGGNMNDFKIPDNLKTHPGCSERALVLQRIMGTQKMMPRTKESLSGDFLYYRDLARFEQVEMLMFYESYGEALYTALQMLTDYPQNTYLKCVAANCLYEILQALQNHKFTKVVDTQDDNYTESYYEFLGVLHNLSNAELKQLTRNFYAANVENADADHAYAGYVRTLIESMDAPKDDYRMLLAAYKKDYNDTHYYALLSKKLNQSKNKN